MVSMKSSDHFHLSKPRWIAKRDNPEGSSLSPASSPTRNSVSANSRLRKTSNDDFTSKSKSNGSPPSVASPKTNGRRNTIEPLDESYVEHQRRLLRNKTDLSNSNKLKKPPEKNNITVLRKLDNQTIDKNYDHNISGNVSVSSVSSSGTTSKVGNYKLPINKKIENMLKSKGYAPSAMKSYSRYCLCTVMCAL